MKILLAFFLLFTLPYTLKAQDPTLGKTKEQIRALIKPNSGIDILRGEDSDTLVLQGGPKTVMYYKNNICYASKSTLPLSMLPVMVDFMKNDAYKKIKENEWVNSSNTVKVEITIMKDTKQLFVETSQIDKGVKD